MTQGGNRDAGRATPACHSVAQVPTVLPARYPGQMCKHFAHRLDVAQDGPSGRIAFPELGVCRLDAGEGVLVLRAAAPDRDALERLQDVIARHLLRFAFREPLGIAWTVAAA